MNNNYRIMDYNVSLLPNQWLRDKERPQSLGEATAQSGLSCGHPGWGLVYHLMLCILSPHKKNVVVETGTNWGAMSIVVAQAIIDSGRDCDFYTIEIDPLAYQLAQKHFLEAGIGNHVNGVCYDSIKWLSAFNRPISACLLDGSHEWEDVVKEFNLVQPLLEPGGIIIFDNTSQGGVSKALEFIKPTLHLPFVSWDPPGIDIYQKEA